MIDRSRIATVAHRSARDDTSGSPPSASRAGLERRQQVDGHARREVDEEQEQDGARHAHRTARASGWRSAASRTARPCAKPSTSRPGIMRCPSPGKHAASAGTPRADPPYARRLLSHQRRERRAARRAEVQLHRVPGVADRARPHRAGRRLGGRGLRAPGRPPPSPSRRARRGSGSGSGSGLRSRALRLDRLEAHAAPRLGVDRLRIGLLRSDLGRSATRPVRSTCRTTPRLRRARRRTRAAPSAWVEGVSAMAGAYPRSPARPMKLR